MELHRTTVKDLTLLGTALIAMLVASANVAEADDEYYMTVFAFQGKARRPEISHTFATFTQLPSAAFPPERSSARNHTISWMPDALDIRLQNKQPEPGRNLSLEESLQLAESLDATVYMWGPYRIEKELYERAVTQVQRLNKKTIAYKVVDVGFRPTEASNCLHAVCDIDADDGLLQTGLAYGEIGTDMVVRHLGRWIIEPGTVHDWVNQKLYPEGISFVHRQIDPAVVAQAKNKQEREGAKGANPLPLPQSQKVAGSTDAKARPAATPPTSSGKNSRK
jgi:hypothetical protein